MTEFTSSNLNFLELTERVNSLKCCFMGYTEQVEYSIYSGPYEHTTTTIEGGDKISSYRHNEEQSAFIRSIFSRLDVLLDIDFKEVDSTQIGQIRIFRAFSNSAWEDRFTGTTGGGTAYTRGKHYDIEWRDVYEDDAFIDVEKKVILHLKKS